MLENNFFNTSSPSSTDGGRCSSWIASMRIYQIIHMKSFSITENLSIIDIVFMKGAVVFEQSSTLMNLYFNSINYIFENIRANGKEG